MWMRLTTTMIGDRLTGDALAPWLQYPESAESFRRMDTIVQTATIGRGRRDERLLRSQPMDISSLEFSTRHGRTTAKAFAEGSATNALAVLVGDRIVHEEYAEGMTAHTRHLLMSVSKSLAALVAGVEVERGRLRVDDPVVRHVPELRDGAYGAARVQDLLDMAVSVDYSMDFENGAAEVLRHDRVAGWHPTHVDDPADIRAFLATLAPGPTVGRSFQYCSATTDVLAWVLERAAGETYLEIFSERLWAEIGAADDALISVDSGGTPYASAGVCGTLRDTLRVGRMILDKGFVDGRAVVPESWLDATFAAKVDAGAGGIVADSPLVDHYPDAFYRNQWWHLGDGTAFAVGLGGQYLWLSPRHDVVISKFSGGGTSSEPDDLINHLAFFSALASSAADSSTDQ